MTIGIDIREACREQKTGKGQWTFGFVQELLQRDVAIEFFTDTPDIPLHWTTKQTKVHLFKPGICWHLSVRRFLQRSRTIDVYVSPTSYIVPAFGSKVPVVPIVHDMIAFRNEPHDTKAMFVERATLRFALRKAAHIFTVSESTSTDLLQKFPFVKNGNVTSIFAGPMQDSPTSNVPDGKTVLCVGTLSPRKNQLSLIHAFNSLPKALREKSRLLLVGSRGWMDDDIVDLATSSMNVEWKGYASDAEYNEYLRTCAVLALPSYYEGFGMQVLDALKRGVPVLTSSRGSLSEVVGNSAVTVDPDDLFSITLGLRDILQDASLQQSLRESGPRQAKKYSWERTVDLFLQTILFYG